jgi:hypothetical protein
MPTAPPSSTRANRPRASGAPKESQKRLKENKKRLDENKRKQKKTKENKRKPKKAKLDTESRLFNALERFRINYPPSPLAITQKPAFSGRRPQLSTDSDFRKGFVGF